MAEAVESSAPINADPVRARSPRLPRHGITAAREALHVALDPTNSALERVTAMRDLKRAKVPKLLNEATAWLGPEVTDVGAVAEGKTAPVTPEDVRAQIAEAERQATLGDTRVRDAAKAQEALDRQAAAKNAAERQTAPWYVKAFDSVADGIQTLRTRPAAEAGQITTKLLLTTAAIFGIGTVVDACAPAAPLPIVKEAQAPAPTATQVDVTPVVPSEKPSPTASPTPFEKPTPVTAGYTQKPDGTFVWKGPDASGKEIDLNVPPIPGLKATLQDNKIIYIAVDGNPYGLAVDGKTEDAEYNPSVSVEGVQVGGLALEAHIAAWYLQNTPASNGIPASLIPADLRLEQ